MQGTAGANVGNPDEEWAAPLSITYRSPVEHEPQSRQSPLPRLMPIFGPRLRRARALGTVVSGTDQGACDLKPNLSGARTQFLMRWASTPGQSSTFIESRDRTVDARSAQWSTVCVLVGSDACASQAQSTPWRGKRDTIRTGSQAWAFTLEEGLPRGSHTPEPCRDRTTAAR